MQQALERGKGLSLEVKNTARRFKQQRRRARFRIVEWSLLLYAASEFNVAGAIPCMYGRFEGGFLGVRNAEGFWVRLCERIAAGLEETDAGRGGNKKS